MIFIVLSKISGLFRDTQFVSYFGINGYSDSYLVSFSIIIMIGSSFTEAIRSSLIEVVSKIENNYENNRSIIIGFIKTYIIIGALAITLLIVLFSRQLTNLWSINFSKESYSNAIHSLRILAFIIPLMCGFAADSAVLNYNKKYGFTSSYQFIINSILIIVLILFKKLSIYNYAIITLISYFLPNIISYLNYPNLARLNLSLKISNSYFKRFIKNFLPLLAASFVYELNAVIDRSFASSLGEGTITILSLAGRINGIVYYMGTVVLSTVLYSNLLEKKAKSEEIFYKYSKHSIIILTVLVIPLSLFVIFMSKDIVSFLFIYRNINTEEITKIGSALTFYGIGLYFSIITEIYRRILYSYSDTKSSAKNSIYSVILNIILNSILIKKYDFIGLALSTSIASIFLSILMVIEIRKKNKKLFDIQNIIITIFSLCATLISLIASNYVLKSYTKFDNRIYLVIYFIIFILIYAIIMFVINAISKNKYLT